MSDDTKFMQRAIDKAAESVAKGGFPAGSVLVMDEKIIGEGISIGNILHDPTSHSDTASIRTACANFKTNSLAGSTLYSSMQPCVMCVGAAMWAGISKIVYACPKNHVASEYYGGTYDIATITNKLNAPINTVHAEDAQKSALAIVHQWEASLKERA